MSFDSDNTTVHYWRKIGVWLELVGHWWKVELAFTHRRTTLEWVHRAINKVLPQPIDFDALVGERRSHHDNHNLNLDLN